MIAGVILALSGGTGSGLQAQTSTPPPCLGVFNFVGSLVKCVVSTTGRYTIGAFGAQGGTGINVGGKGAWVQDDFDLTAGTVLTIIVGGTGTGFRTGAALSAGGGGGSFVFGDNPAELWCTGGSGCPVGYESQGAPWPLLVAGGGGGAGTSFDGEPGGIFNYYNVVPGGGPPCVAQFPPPLFVPSCDAGLGTGGGFNLYSWEGFGGNAGANVQGESGGGGGGAAAL